MSNKATFERLRKDLITTDNEFAQAFADEFVKRVKARTPVRGGTLQRGWKSKVSEKEILIENRVDYAGYVEDGTEHMKGAHMAKTTMGETGRISQIAQNKIRNKRG